MRFDRHKLFVCRPTCHTLACSIHTDNAKVQYSVVSYIQFSNHCCCYFARLDDCYVLSQWGYQFAGDDEPQVKQRFRVPIHIVNENVIVKLRVNLLLSNLF